MRKAPRRTLPSCRRAGRRPRLPRVDGQIDSQLATLMTQQWSFDERKKGVYAAYATYPLMFPFLILSPEHGPRRREVRAVGSLLPEPRIVRAALPMAKLLLDVVLGQTVAFLDLAGELIAPAGNDVKIVVGQLAPLFLDPARDLFPVALNAIPVHTISFDCKERARRYAFKPSLLAAARRAAKPIYAR